MAIDISSCLTAIQSMKSKVAGCFSKCAEKGSTYSGTKTLSNLLTAIDSIPSGSGGLLPNGYTQLEYIESTGTQYIDTGFKPNNNTRVVLDISELATSTQDECVFGSRQASGNTDYSLWLLKNSEKFQSSFGNEKVQVTSMGITNKRIYDKNKSVFSVNGELLISHTESVFQTAYDLFLMCCNTAGNPQTHGVTLKLYSCQIYDNGTLVRDFIPCKNPSGVIGLYDLVNDVFYSNNGTGTFIAGGVVQGLSGASFGGFDITYGDNSYTINFGSIGVSWKSLVCYSDTKDGHFAIHKMSNNKCVICASVFYDASNQFDEAFGIFPNQRNTYRATYSVSGNSITFTNAEYDGTSNGMTNHDSFGAMPQQVSTDVNDYFTNQYKLDRITVVF